MADKNAPGSQDLELADAIEALRTELEKTLAESPPDQLPQRPSLPSCREAPAPQ